jgi:hypothetical protein
MIDLFIVDVGFVNLAFDEQLLGMIDQVLLLQFYLLFLHDLPFLYLLRRIRRCFFAQVDLSIILLQQLPTILALKPAALLLLLVHLQF